MLHTEGKWGAGEMLQTDGKWDAASFGFANARETVTAGGKARRVTASWARNRLEGSRAWFTSRLRLLHVRAALHQVRGGLRVCLVHHLAVKQLHRPVGHGRVARIVRHHADRGSLVV